MIDPITTIKISFLKSFMYLPFVVCCMEVCQYFKLDCELMALLMFTMILDFITGWYKATALGNPITLKKLKAGFYSKVIVFVILLSWGVLVTALNIVNPKVVEFFNLQSYISMVIFIMILNEIYSIFGNIKSGRTKVEVKEIDFITMFIRAVRRKLEKIMTEKSEDIDRGM